MIEGLTAAEANVLFKAVETTRSLAAGIKEAGFATRISEKGAQHIINWYVKQKGNLAAIRAGKVLEAAEAAGTGGRLIAAAKAALAGVKTTLAGVSWATVGAGVLVGVVAIGIIGGAWVKLTQAKPIAVAELGDPDARKRDGTYEDGPTAKVKFPSLAVKPATKQPSLGPKKSTKSAKPQEPWGVYLVGDDVMIGHKTEIENRKLYQMSKWGTDHTKKVGQVVTLQELAGPFETELEAYNAFCDLVIDGTAHTLPLRAGSKAKFSFDGQYHAINNTWAPPTEKWKK